jgi:hypothetical protein
MRYELTDYEWAANVAEQGARRASCGRSSRPQRHLLGAIRRTMARYGSCTKG